MDGLKKTRTRGREPAHGLHEDPPHADIRQSDWVFEANASFRPRSGRFFLSATDRIHPQLDRWPQIGHAALIELKYLKAKDDASPEALAKIKFEAVIQLDKYAAGKDLATEWRLKPQGTVQLTCLAIVFHGSELALCEEI